MRTTKIRSKFSLLFIALAAMIAIPAAVAFADNVQTNDVDTGGNASKQADTTGTATARIVGNNAPNGDVSGCNVTSTEKATVTFSANSPNITFPGGNSVQIEACGNAGAKQLEYKVSSSATVGDVYTISTSTTGGKTDSLYNEDSFTVTVLASTQSNTAPSVPGTPTLAPLSSTPNQGTFGLEWTASTDNQNDPITYRLEHRDADDADYSLVSGAGSLSSNSYSFTSSNQEGEGTWTYKVQASDGNLSSAFSDASAAIKVDRTAPTFGACPTAGPFLLNSGNGSQSVGPISASDGTLPDTSSGSGVNTADSTLSGSVDTSSIGTKEVIFTAKDFAGNEAQRICNYSVIYDFKGFFRPVDNLPTVNSIKAGSAVPVKFSLSGNQGLNIFVSGSPTSQKINCDTSAPVDAIEETTTAGNSSLSYDSSTDTYSYVWKTDKAWAGTCRQLSVTLADGKVYKANFKLLK